MLFFVAVGAVPLGAGPLRAEEKVKVTVVAILANDRDDTVDPELKCIAEEVQKLEPTLTGFKLHRSSRKSLAVGDPYKFNLVDEEVAAVVIKHGCDKDDRVGLTVKAPQQGEIEYSSACGKYLPIVTRYQTKGKDRLIIAIMVKPCKGK